MINTPSRALRRLLPALLLAIVLTPAAARAGGQLVAFDFTGFPGNLPPGPVPGSSSVDVIPIRWDLRCLPEHRFNTASLPTNAQPPLDAAAARAVFEAAMESWNAIPTSYIELKIVDEIVRPRTGPFDVDPFDFVNEVNFLLRPEDGIVAFSTSANITMDAFVAAGTDFDLDGDSDFFDPAVVGSEFCVDADGDGDIEFPAGFYEAGAILDNDAAFNDSLVVWTTGPPDTVFGQIDLQGVATHEFGHSHGLSHTAINQLSAADGTSPAMINSLDTTDANGELALRSLSPDDVAWSSFVYPEGSAASGPPALQPGDVAFDEVYGVITGEVFHGELGLPLVGASIAAIDRDSGETVVSHVTGNARFAFQDFFSRIFLEFPEFHLQDGIYTLPVPAGEYHVAIEALDGAPFTSGAINIDTIFGGIFGLQDFHEEFLLKPGKDEFEPLEVEVEAGETVAGIDHTTSIAVELDGFDTLGTLSPDLDEAGFVDAPPGRIYAVAVPADEVAELLDAGLEPKSAAFRTFLPEASQAVTYPRAGVVTGSANGAGAVLDLEDPLVEVEDFVGQDNDFSPLFFREPADTAEDLEEAIDEGASHFFLVLELPASFGGLFELPPLIGLDAGQEAGLLGRSYVSDDGGATFVQVPDVNFMFRLIFG